MDENRTESRELNLRINTLIMRGLSASEARYQALTEQGNVLAGLIAAFDAEKARIEADQMTRFTDEEREAIREDTQRLGFDRACERYGEGTVRAAWLPED